MRLRLRSEQTIEARPGPPWPGTRTRNRFRSAVETGVLAGLLLAIVASAIVGSYPALFCAVAGAWLSLAGIVGPRRVLDAGCVFMLVVVGVILVVDLAANGPGSLLP